MTEKELKQLSKVDLELLGREEGIELDRRFNKGKLIKQLLEIYDAKPDCGCGDTDDEGGKCDGSHAKAQAKVEEVVEEEEEVVEEDTTPPWIKLGIPERQYNRLRNNGKI
jgi:CDGSH-type Zn-finger protein